MDGRDATGRACRGTPWRLEVLVRPDGLDVLEMDGDGARCGGGSPIPADGGRRGAADSPRGRGNPPRHPGDPTRAGGDPPGDLLVEALSALGVRCRRRFSSPCG